MSIKYERWCGINWPMTHDVLDLTYTQNKKKSFPIPSNQRNKIHTSPAEDPFQPPQSLRICYFAILCNFNEYVSLLKLQSLQPKPQSVLGTLDCEHNFPISTLTILYEHQRSTTLPFQTSKVRISVYLFYLRVYSSPVQCLLQLLFWTLAYHRKCTSPVNEDVNSQMIWLVGSSDSWKAIIHLIKRRLIKFSFWIKPTFFHFANTLLSLLQAQITPATPPSTQTNSNTQNCRYYSSARPDIFSRYRHLSERAHRIQHSFG